MSNTGGINKQPEDKPQKQQSNPGQGQLEIYVFTNIIYNYCKGDYYFISDSEENARILADQFAADHNEMIENNRHYKIEWKPDVTSHAIIEGFLPINRIYLPMPV